MLYKTAKDKRKQKSGQNDHLQRMKIYHTTLESFR